MSRNWRFQIRKNKDGSLYTPGISWGYGSDNLKIVHERHHHLILKKKGTTEWSGRGESSYFKPRYMLCKILEHRDDESMKVEVLAEYELGKKWRTGMTHLKKAVHELATDQESIILEELDFKIKELINDNS